MGFFMSELKKKGKEELESEQSSDRYHPQSLMKRWLEEEDPFGPADDNDAGPFGFASDSEK